MAAAVPNFAWLEYRVTPTEKGRFLDDDLFPTQLKAVGDRIEVPDTPGLGVEFNEEAFRQIMESNIQAGVDGFWISGGTGESVLLTEDEVIRTAQISVELCRGRAKSIVHIGALTTRGSVRMARAAAANT